MKRNTSNHAVVIGGSIAGLATARILSDYFERITIVERDHAPQNDDYRNGVPQQKQPHALLKRGLIELEQLFPGFGAEWEANGAVPVDFGKNVEWYAFGRWRPHYEPGLQSYSSSRPLLEGTIRRRLEANPKICFINETEVIGLVANDSASRVIGIRTRSRSVAQVEDVIQADLIVDASGRSSHAIDWLQELGYDRPETSVINAFPGYASRVFERPQNMDCSVMYMQPTPSYSKRGAIALPLEGNRIHVCTIGMAKDYPATDEEGFLNFLATLPEKHMYNLVKEAKPLSPIVGYRRAENVLHHFDQLSRWPDNFIALGDSVYAFNPVYGQGMTVAIMAAVKLGECLQAQQEIGDGLAAHFQKELGKLIAFPWQLATGEDMRWLPVTEGCPAKLDMPTTLRLGFMKKVMVASTKDPMVTEAFYRVLNMTASPAAFVRPAIMARVLAA